MQLCPIRPAPKFRSGRTQAYMNSDVRAAGRSCAPHGGAWRERQGVRSLQSGLVLPRAEARAADASGCKLVRKSRLVNLAKK